MERYTREMKQWTWIIVCKLKDVEAVTNYNTDEIIPDSLNYENNIISFTYFGEEVTISKDNNNSDGIIINGIDTDELLTIFEDYGYSIDITYMMVNWDYKFCFLTQKAAENYLKRKGHRHSVDAHTYCICTYQDLEIAKLMEIIEMVDWGKLAVNNVSI